MGRVDVDGVGIEYDVTGDGPPVVLLHGFPDSGRLWRHQVPALAEAGFQVIAPDLRGYGRSGKPEAIEAYSLLHPRPFQDHDVSPRIVKGRSMERPAHRVASVTSVRPARRRAPMARLRRPAMILGPDRVLTWDLSSW